MISNLDILREKVDGIVGFDRYATSYKALRLWRIGELACIAEFLGLSESKAWGNIVREGNRREKIEGDLRRRGTAHIKKHRKPMTFKILKDSAGYYIRVEYIGKRYDSQHRSMSAEWCITKILSISRFICG